MNDAVRARYGANDVDEESTWPKAECDTNIVRDTENDRHCYVLRESRDATTITVVHTS